MTVITGIFVEGNGSRRLMDYNSGRKERLTRQLMHHRVGVGLWVYGLGQWNYLVGLDNKMGLNIP